MSISTITILQALCKRHSNGCANGKRSETAVICASLGTQVDSGLKNGKIYVLEAAEKRRFNTHELGSTG